MKETRAAEEAMLASMVLSVSGARTLETAVADSENKVKKENQEAVDQFNARPTVFVQPCDVCIALREVKSANDRKGKTNAKKGGTGKENADTKYKLCSKCSKRAVDLAAAEIKLRRQKKKEAEEDLLEAKKSGTYKPSERQLAKEEAARAAAAEKRNDPTNATRGFEDLEKDLRTTEKNVALAKTPEQRVKALHRCSQLRVAMKSAVAQRDAEVRRQRIEQSKKKEKKVEDDERWLSR